MKSLAHAEVYIQQETWAQLKAAPKGDKAIRQVIRAISQAKSDAAAAGIIRTEEDIYNERRQQVLAVASTSSSSSGTSPPLLLSGSPPPSSSALDEACELMGLPVNFTLPQLESRWRKLAKIQHTDKGGKTEGFQQLDKARQLLSRFATYNTTCWYQKVMSVKPLKKEDGRYHLPVLIWAEYNGQIVVGLLLYVDSEPIHHGDPTHRPDSQDFDFMHVVRTTHIKHIGGTTPVHEYRRIGTFVQVIYVSPVQSELQQLKGKWFSSTQSIMAQLGCPLSGYDAFKIVNTNISLRALLKKALWMNHPWLVNGDLPAKDGRPFMSKRDALTLLCRYDWQQEMNRLGAVEEADQKTIAHISSMPETHPASLAATKLLLAQRQALAELDLEETAETQLVIAQKQTATFLTSSVTKSLPVPFIHTRWTEQEMQHADIHHLFDFLPDLGSMMDQHMPELAPHSFHFYPYSDDTVVQNAFDLELMKEHYVTTGAQSVVGESWFSRPDVRLYLVRFQLKNQLSLIARRESCYWSPNDTSTDFEDRPCVFIPVPLPLLHECVGGSKDELDKRCEEIGKMQVRGEELLYRETDRDRQERRKQLLLKPLVKRMMEAVFFHVSEADVVLDPTAGETRAELASRRRDTFDSVRKEFRERIEQEVGAWLDKPTKNYGNTDERMDNPDDDTPWKLQNRRLLDAALSEDDTEDDYVTTGLLTPMAHKLCEELAKVTLVWAQTKIRHQQATEAARKTRSMIFHTTVDLLLKHKYFVHKVVEELICQCNTHGVTFNQTELLETVRRRANPFEYVEPEDRNEQDKVAMTWKVFMTERESLSVPLYLTPWCLSTIEMEHESESKVANSTSNRFPTWLVYCNFTRLVHKLKTMSLDDAVRSMDKAISFSPGLLTQRCFLHFSQLIVGHRDLAKQPALERSPSMYALHRAIKTSWKQEDECVLHERRYARDQSIIHPPRFGVPWHLALPPPRNPLPPIARRPRTEEAVSAAPPPPQDTCAPQEDVREVKKRCVRPPRCWRVIEVVTSTTQAATEQ